MGNYKMIAFDMDGTLLTSNQTISSEVHEAIERAIDAGKHVVICTGRGPNELADYKDKEFDRIRFYVTENGGYVFDSVEKKPIAVTPIAEECVRAVFDAAEGEDAMIVIQGEGQSKAKKDDIDRMEYFGAGRYKDIEQRTAVFLDVVKCFRQKPFQVEKINVYAHEPEIRDRIYNRVKDLPVTIVYAEYAGFEVSPPGMSKAVGLTALCESLNIPMNEVIAVGDSDNDVEMLKCVGLPVAVENARECIKEVSLVSVADNDHDGCAEAIDKYLLS